jgi:hypothetical protein
MMRPFFQVDEQHLARLQAPLGTMLLFSTGSTPASDAMTKSSSVTR